jgi:hypothetical protein
MSADLMQRILLSGGSMVQHDVNQLTLSPLCENIHHSQRPEIVESMYVFEKRNSSRRASDYRWGNAARWRTAEIAVLQKAAEEFAG